MINDWCLGIIQVQQAIYLVLSTCCFIWTTAKPFGRSTDETVCCWGEEYYSLKWHANANFQLAQAGFPFSLHTSLTFLSSLFFVPLQRAPVWSPASAVSSCPLATVNRPWLLCSACSGESASLPGTHWTCWPWSSTHPTRGRPLRHALKSAWHLRRRGQWCWMTCWMTSRELPCVDWPARSDGWHCGVKSLVVRVM